MKKVWMKGMMIACAAGAAALLMSGAFDSTQTAKAQDKGPIRILSLTRSAGYEHSVIKREKGALGHAEKILAELAEKNGFEIYITKDAGMINEHQLKFVDVVHFYTTGELCEQGGDNNPPMSEAGRQALLDWVKAGGGFAGTHTTTDTFHKWEENGEYPYLKMVGGEFAWHGKQQEADMEVKPHPTTEHLGDQWTLTDEYYLFQKHTQTFTPLLILNTKKMEEERYRNSDPYASTWCEEYGMGRVFNTALGHREDVWTNPKYQELVVRGIKWAAGRL